MASGVHIIPPLLSSILQLRDSLPWSDATKVSPEVSIREAVTPYGQQKAMRFAVSIPDVQACVFAQLANSDDDAHPNVADGLMSRFKSSPDATVEAQGHDKVRLEHLVAENGGVDPDSPTCPSWYPALPVSAAPLDPEVEQLFHFRHRVHVPGMKDRDFAGRITKLVDFSDASPVVKEAIGSTSEAVFVFAMTSCRETLPAFRNCVRGGMTGIIVLQGPGGDRRGAIADSFWMGEPMSNAVTLTAFRRMLAQDHLHMVKFARLLQGSFQGPVAFGDKALLSAAIELARDVRRRRFGDDGAGSDFGGCGSTCSLQ